MRILFVYEDDVFGLNENLFG